MIEVKLIEQDMADMNRRIVGMAAEARIERTEGLAADWTAIAEGLEAVRDSAERAAAAAWRITHESI